MKQNIVDILKGKFLISDDAVKNWRFILFASLLAVVMIASSHNADQKVHDIARLNEQVQELRSEFVDTRSRLQRLKLESTIVTKLKDYGLQPSAEPPRKIRVTTK
ncbi:FtsL-like putative cell division protein [Imtechella halotolerans]|uniref:S-adenosyl-methyltransferase MraW n=1 Tax=Imtechella halotolerans K1 TaxID=946077 RepID=I0WKM0_9FLAO|nr:FtsL-like putative cell division protein [Imtechella halotolerans]EID76936.1 S-adenosyl-methyltransferase MraW [Imtechella halotolerans K1]WMQ62504.1 FtsL-like putative cell division protein [Imtechella halotolerans]